MNFRTRCGLSALVLISFIACTKNNNHANPGVLTGTWKLTSTTGTLVNLYTFERNDTLVKGTENQSYYSTSAAGTVTFSGDTVIPMDFFVHAMVTQSTAQYFNGVLNQDTTRTYGYDQNGINANSNFELIGRDSLHFDGPGIPLTGGLSPFGTAGAKYTISGDTLTLNTQVYQNDSTSPSNLDHGVRTMVTVLTRQ